jgi:hypothetical protein
MIGRRLPLLLVIALAVGLALAWWLPQLRWAPPAPIPPEIQPAPQPAPTTHVEAGREALARPLFWESRRPAAGPSGAAVASSLDELKIVGLIRNGEHAVLIATHADRSLRLVVGQSYADWLFEGIQGDLALFRRGDAERQSLRIPRRRVDDLPHREIK